LAKEVKLQRKLVAELEQRVSTAEARGAASAHASSAKQAAASQSSAQEAEERAAAGKVLVF